MVLWIIARVVQRRISCDIFVDVIRFYFQQKAVCVCVKGLAFFSVLLFQLVVEKVLHQYLTVVKDGHPGVDRFIRQHFAFVHVDPRHVVCKFSKG